MVSFWDLKGVNNCSGMRRDWTRSWMQRVWTHSDLRIVQLIPDDKETRLGM